MKGRMMNRMMRAAPGAALAMVLAACAGDAVSPLRTNTAPDPGTIQGVVATEDGSPVAGVRVELVSERTDSTHRAVSDAAGKFTFTALPAGRYNATAVPPSGYEPLGPAPAAVRLAPGRGAELPVPLRAILRAEVTVRAGEADTIALASGAVVAVQAPAGSAPVTVRAETARPAVFSGFDLVAPAVTLTTATATPAAAGTPRAAMAAAASPDVTVRVWQRMPTCTGASAEMAFEVGTYGGGPPLFLYADAACTTYVDPATGESGSALLASAEHTPGRTTHIGGYVRESTCAASSLYPFPGTTPDPAKIPLILVHGWQPTETRCRFFQGWEPGQATFGPLAGALQADPVIGGRYSLYVLRYPTFLPVANASEFLRQEIVRLGWQDRDIALVAHSMGGLVARGYMAAYGSQRIRAAVTLATPHLGSPLAPLTGTEPAVRTCMKGYGWLALRFLPRTAGLADLEPNGAWITLLRDKREGATRLYTLAGETAAPGGFTYGRTQCLLNELGAGPNDAVVPVASALPDWTTLQTPLAGLDHSTVTERAAIPQVRHILRTVAQCRPGPVPAPPASNGFPLSGSLARHPDGRIDVILNPVVVDGTPVRGLTAANFAVIENDCVKDFSITTSDGNLGVDLVFVQDLSGSMSSTITGVRNSVLAFADDLRARGVNVQIGSVGFSGPGTITTHAGQSTCERVGPVQNLSTPAAFRDHVSAAWSATGGCDSPENALEAIEYAHRNMAWRAGAARAYILITDVSIHTRATNCNGLGACTDQDLASILALIGGTATLHAVAPSSAALRTTGGGLDPWLIAEGTGGAKLVLPAGGAVNLNALGITDKIADVVRLTFISSSPDRASHRVRVRVQANGKVAELSPGLVRYDVDPTLQRSP